MDSITTAIVAALAVGAVSGLTKVGEQVVVDAYTKLKDLLKSKFGARSKVVRAVKELEANPDSKARKDVVQEEVAAAKADKDPELLAAAQALIEVVKAEPDGAQIIQNAIAIGNGNIQIAGDGNKVTMTEQKPRR